MVRIERALPQHAPLAAALLKEAALWLVEIGQKNWEPEWFVPEYFAENAACGELWLGWHEQTPVATMLLMETDSDFWPNDLPGEALYLHKLAVARSAAGQGVAQAMLAKAEQLTREAGAGLLRLDCRADRPKLRAVYESAGFTLVDERIVFGWFPAARYEKMVP